MGSRYFIYCECPKCGEIEDDVYFAPTCGFTEWICPKCGYVLNLCDYTGISFEDASNKTLIEKILKGR